MSDLMRMSFSIDEPLFQRLEKLVRESHYTNRSEFVRDMIREQLVGREWDENRETLGTVTLVYNHHFRKLSDKLTELQHHHHKTVLAAMHVHLDEHVCAEVILIKGKAGLIRQIADLLRQQKGVLHSALAMSSTGEDLV
ncbi:MAG TPA: nickel-responsive transcriptional regulator NikR [Planctomycetota bacterium]